MVLPPNFLGSDASNRCFFQAPNASTTKAPNLSRLVRAHTYIKHKRWGFWHPFHFGSMGVRNKWNPNIIICKIYKIYSIKAKSCKITFAATMCTFVHSSMHVRIGVIMCACDVCHGCWPIRLHSPIV